jgi:hypothetical protein
LGISFTAMAIAGNTEAMEMAQRDAENNTALVKYDAMCRAIDAAYRVDEVKEIRDKAAALEHYSRLAKNTENERRACEIRLRAERKAGQLLAKTRKAKAGRPPKGKSIVRDDRLRDQGISLDQSSNWQKLGKVPQADFDAALAQAEKPTTKGIIRRTSEKQPLADCPICHGCGAITVDIFTGCDRKTKMEASYGRCPCTQKKRRGNANLYAELEAIRDAILATEAEQPATEEKVTVPSDMASPNEELKLLREFAAFVVGHTTVKTDSKDYARWKALLGRVRATLGVVP